MGVGFLTNVATQLPWQFSALLFVVAVVVLAFVELVQLRAASDTTGTSGELQVSDLVEYLATQVGRQIREELAGQFGGSGSALKVSWTNGGAAAAVAPPIEVIVGHRGHRLVRPLSLSGQTSTAIEDFMALPRRQLVILGDAGAGKTVLAYQLARDALVRRDELGHRVPVVATIASWRPEVDHFEAWFAQHLALNYGGTEAAWIGVLASGAIMPILDGLDEVAAGKQVIALQELDRVFQTDTPFVLTSRTDGYLRAVAGAGRLAAAAVVELEPLSASTVTEYLDPQEESRWTAIRRELLEHPSGDLAVALSIPLYAGLAVGKYRLPSTRPAELLDFGSSDSIKRFLLDAFLSSAYMDKPRRPDDVRPTTKPFDTRDSRKWLTRLASQLTAAGRTDIAWWVLPRSLNRNDRRALRITAAVSLAALFGTLFWNVGSPEEGVLVGSIAAIAAGRVLGIDQPVGVAMKRLSMHIAWRRPRLRGNVFAIWVGIGLGLTVLGEYALDGWTDLVRYDDADVSQLIFPEIFVIGVSIGFVLGIGAGPIAGIDSELGDTRYLGVSRAGILSDRLYFEFTHLVFIISAGLIILSYGLMAFQISGFLTIGRAVGILAAVLILGLGIAASAFVVHYVVLRESGLTVVLGLASGLTVGWLTLTYASSSTPLEWILGIAFALWLGLGFYWILRLTAKPPRWLQVPNVAFGPRWTSGKPLLGFRPQYMLSGATLGAAMASASLVADATNVRSAFTVPAMAIGSGLVLGLVGNVGEEADPEHSDAARTVLRRDRRFTVLANLTRASIMTVAMTGIFWLTSGDPSSSLASGAALGLATFLSLAFGFAILGAMSISLIASIAYPDITLIGFFGYGIAGGLLFGLPVWMLESRGSWLGYRTSATALALRGAIPWRYLNFLEDARARGVLRQFGAVYQFRHQDIQQYLAATESHLPQQRPDQNGVQRRTLPLPLWRMVYALILVLMLGIAVSECSGHHRPFDLFPVEMDDPRPYEPAPSPSCNLPDPSWTCHEGRPFPPVPSELPPRDCPAWAPYSQPNCNDSSPSQPTLPPSPGDSVSSPGA